MLLGSTPKTAPRPCLSPLRPGPIWLAHSPSVPAALRLTWTHARNPPRRQSTVTSRVPSSFSNHGPAVVSRSDDSLQASSWPVPAMSGISLTVNADASAKAVALDVRFVRPAVPETTAETAHRRNRRVASWGIKGRAANAGARVGAAQSDRTAANGSATSAHFRGESIGCSPNTLVSEAWSRFGTH